jgi:nucleotide-binding universal stress UspA family protein
MFKSILAPIDLADTDHLAKPAVAAAATLANTWNGTVRLLYVLPMTPAMLAEYVPADFDTQQRQTAEEALAIVARESGIEP